MTIIPLSSHFSDDIQAMVEIPPTVDKRAFDEGTYLFAVCVYVQMVQQ